MQAILKSFTNSSQRLSFLLACGAVLLGCIGLSGWLFDSFLLRSFFFADTTMKVNTALLIIVTGCSLLLQHQHWQKTSTALLLLCGIFCVLIISEHLWHINFNIDEWWFKDKDAKSLHDVPGRTSLLSASSLLTLIVIQLLSSFKKYYTSQFIGLLLLLVIYAILMGYMFSISGFYRQGEYSGVAFHTELSLLLLNTSILLSQAAYGWMQLIMFFLRSRKGLLVLAAYLLCAAPLLVSIYVFCINEEQMSSAAGVIVLVILSLLVNLPIAYIVLSRIYRTDNTLKKTNQQLEIALIAGKLGSYNLHIATGNMICSAQCKANYGLPADANFDFPDLMQLVLPVYRAMIQEKVNKAVDTNSTYEAEYQITWPDGSLHWVKVSGKPDYDENGNATTMIGITQDITAQKETEAQKNAFIGVVSHEMKTPLTSLKAYLQLLNIRKAETELDLFNSNIISKAETQVNKMVTLIKGFLNVSRLEAGMMQIDKTSFLLDRLLEEVVQEHHFIQSSHQIVLHGCAGITVIADREKIAHVISNLLGNAVKYSPQTKNIEMKCAVIDHEVRVSVTDNGIGIPVSELPYLFNRFYRADTKEAHVISGFGIGLYLSAEIIKMHNGSIWVESEPGKGSTFFFSLPLP